MEYTDLSNLIIKKIFSVNTISTSTGETSTRKNRAFWSFLIKYEGETIYTSGGKQIKSNIENVALLPKGSNYSWICTHGGRFIIIDFDADVTNKQIITVPTKKSENILKLFNELEKVWNLKHPLYELESMKIAYEIFYMLLSSFKEYSYSGKQEKIRPALDYIAANYQKPITNDELSSLLNISTVYFRKLFTSSVGMSPINYIHHLRINKAKEMLQGDFAKISVIAEAVGYSNIYYFSKVFKQHTGISPSEYVKKIINPLSGNKY